MCTMSTVVQCHQNLQKLLECPICLQLLQDPSETICRHYFCSKCIQSAMKQKNTIPCPLCKTSISKRKIKRATNIHDLVQALDKVNEASKKELAGAEAEGLSSGFSEGTNASASMKRSETSSKQTKGKVSNDKKYRRKTRKSDITRNTLFRQKDESSTFCSGTPDLLDVIDNMTSKSTKCPARNESRSASTASSVTYKKLVEGASATTLPHEVTAIKDPFEFPVSQNQPNVHKKPKKKFNTTKSIKKQKEISHEAGKSRKSSSSDTKILRKSAQREKAFNMSPQDEQIVSMIKNTEHHKLTVSHAVSPSKTFSRTDDNQKTFPKDKSTERIPAPKLCSPEKRRPNCPIDLSVRSTVAGSERNGSEQNTTRSPRSANASKKQLSSHNSKDANKKNCKDLPLSGIREESVQFENQLVHKKDKVSADCHKPELSVVEQCVVSSDSSLAEAENLSVNCVNNHSSPSYENKVNSWLEKIEPSASPPEDSIVSHDGSEKECSGECDSEDFTSISQVSIQNQQVIVRRRKKTIPSIHPQTCHDKTTDTVFGKHAAQRKYGANNKGTNVLLPNNIAFDQPENAKPKAATKQCPRRSAPNTRKRKLSNAFDVDGLSQGVSPFSTPVEEEVNRVGCGDAESRKSKTTAQELESSERKLGDERVGARSVRARNVIDHQETEIEKTRPHDKDAASVHASDSRMEVFDDGDTATKPHVAGISPTKAKVVVMVSSEEFYLVPQGAPGDSPSATKPVCQVKKYTTQDSSADGIVQPVTTVVEAVVHRQDSQLQQKLVASASLDSDCTHLEIADSSSLSTDQPAARLENAPTACVGQVDDTGKPKCGYYVDTPSIANHNLVSAVSKANHEISCSVGNSPSVAKRSPVELNLLDLSQPTQATSTAQPHTNKIMETCWMVIGNLNKNRLDLVENIAEDANDAQQCDSDTQARPPSLVGRVVNLEKVSKRKAVCDGARTMEEIHDRLSQLERSNGHGADKLDEENAQGGRNGEGDTCGAKAAISGDGSSVPSLYACPSPTSEPAAVSSCDTELILDSNASQERTQVLPPANPVQEVLPRKKQLKSVRKRKSSVQRQKRSKAPKTRTGLQLGNSEKDDCIETAVEMNSASNLRTGMAENPLSRVEVTKKTSPSKTLNDVPPSGKSDRKVTSRSPNKGDIAGMMCTSNGWGGTKLKIRFFRNKPKKSRAINSESDEGHNGNGAIHGCDAEVPHTSRSTEDCALRGLRSEDRHNDRKSSDKAGASDGKKQNALLDKPTAKSVAVVPPKSPVVIADSLQVDGGGTAMSRRARLKNKCPAVENQSTEREPALSRADNHVGVQIVSDEEDETIHSSWPSASLPQKSETAVPSALTSCGILHHVTVRLDKIDPTRLPKYCRPQAEPESKVTASNDAEGENASNEDVIPSSPLLFAASQSVKPDRCEEVSVPIEIKASDGVGSKSPVSKAVQLPSSSWQHSQTPVEEIGANAVGLDEQTTNDLDETKVKASADGNGAAGHQNGKTSPSPECVEVPNHFDNATPINEILQSFQELKALLDCACLNKKQRGLVDDGWEDVVSLATALGDKLKCIAKRSESEEGTPDEIWHAGKRSKRKVLPLSDCEEDDTEVGLPVDANSSRLLQGESQASNAPSTQSKGEITCSLPTIYPLRSKRRRFETVPSCSTSDVTKQPGPLAAAVKTPGVGDQEAFVEDGLAIDGVENQAGVAKEPIVIPLQKTADDQVLVPDSFQQQICQVSAKSTNVPALSQEIPVVEETAELAQDEQGIGSPQEDEAEIRDTPLSPSNTSVSEHEIVPIETETHDAMDVFDEVCEKAEEDCPGERDRDNQCSKPMSAVEDAQQFSAQDYPSCVDDSQPPITESQLSSLTPPPPMSKSVSADMSEVNDLLRKISEITKDYANDVASCAKSERPEEEAIAQDDDMEGEETSRKTVSPNVSQPVCSANTEVFATCASHLPSDAAIAPQENVAPVTAVASTIASRPDHSGRTPLSPRPIGNVLAATETVRSSSNEIKKSVGEKSDHTSPNVSLSTVSLPDASFISCSDKPLGIMASGIRGKASMLIRKFANKYRGRFYETFVAGEVTHVIVPTDDLKCDRTMKYLQGIASKIWVLSSNWIKKCVKEKTLVPENTYEVISDNMDIDPNYLYAPKRARESSKDFKLLAEYAVHCIPPFALFSADQCRELVAMCGAKVADTLGDLSECEPTKKRVIVLDTDAYTDSLPNYAEMARCCKAEAVSVGWVLECVATFSVQPTSLFPVEEFESQLD